MRPRVPCGAVQGIGIYDGDIDGVGGHAGRCGIAHLDLQAIGAWLGRGKAWFRSVGIIEVYGRRPAEGRGATWGQFQVQVVAEEDIGILGDDAIGQGAQQAVHFFPFQGSVIDAEFIEETGEGVFICSITLAAPVEDIAVVAQVDAA